MLKFQLPAYAIVEMNPPQRELIDLCVLTHRKFLTFRAIPIHLPTA
jgi:hypothetical protein